MLGIFLAIAAGCGWGASSVLVRLGLLHIEPSLGTFLSLFSSFVVAGSLALILNFDAFTSLHPKTVLWFGLIGLLNYGIGRQFNYFSIRYIGVARATSIFSSAPLFAVSIAVLFTGETINFYTGIGTLCIVGGLYLVITGR